MLLILASQYDEAARALARCWSSYDAALLSPDSLCREGWRYDDARPEGSRAVVDGTPLRAEELRGVLVRLPSVPQDELVQLRPEERAYVAVEMTAFLLAWLSHLPCPVLNRPTAQCLAGPGWRPEQWLHAAARAGLPTVPLRRGTGELGSVPAPTDDATPLACVTVVGRRCLGATTPTLARHARCLADAAGVELLSVQFVGPPRAPRVAGASLWPELDAPLSEALLERLEVRS